MKNVVLLTAGIGSRMGKYAGVINKTLLPINEEAIITHIIKQFDPCDTNFIVALGYKGDLVKTYLKLAHEDCKFTFVDVDNFDGIGSGPAYSLQCCKPYIDGPFYLIACDAWYEQLNTIPSDENYICVSNIDKSESNEYCNVVLDGNAVVSVIDKRYSDSGIAFNGALHIKDTDAFWASLGGLELSSGWTALDSKAFTIPWVDLGKFDKYKQFYLKKSPYDFSKTDEFLYIVNGRVIKWFKDPQIAINRFDRSASHIFPDIDYVDDKGFYSYKFVPGKTLYEHVTLDIFQELMRWLAFNAWSQYDPKKCITREMCVDFYYTKTMKRLEMFHEKYPSFNPKNINGVEMKVTIESGLKLIDWEEIFSKDLQQRTAFIHGDLQFDNIIYDGSKFTLLDWRQDFAGSLEIGDVYYDIAKLLGGMIIHYDLIKKNEFEYVESTDGQQCSFKMHHHESYAPIIDRLRHMLPDMLIEQIVTLIFLNMAPLHSAPFDKVLYCTALERLNVLA